MGDLAVVALVLVLVQAMGNGQRLTDLYIKPAYKFGDVNVKFTGRFSENDSYYLSLYTAGDRFKFDVLREDSFAINAEDNSRQYAGAASYNRVWSSGSSSRFLLHIPRLNSESDQVTRVKWATFYSLGIISYWQSYSGKRFNIESPVCSLPSADSNRWRMDVLSGGIRTV